MSGEGAAEPASIQAQPSLLPKEWRQEPQVPLCSPNLFNIPDICTHLAAGRCTCLILNSRVEIPYARCAAGSLFQILKPLPGDIVQIHNRFTATVCLTSNAWREVAFFSLLMSRFLNFLSNIFNLYHPYSGTIHSFHCESAILKRNASLLSISDD